MNPQLPSLSAVDVLDSLASSADGLWVAPDNALSLDSHRELRRVAIEAKLHLVDSCDVFEEQSYKLLWLVIQHLPVDAQEEADFSLRESAGSGIPGWVVLLSTFVRGCSIEELASLPPAELDTRINEGYANLLQQAQVDLSLQTAERLSRSDITINQLAAHYAITGALEDWQRLIDERERGWLPDHLIPIVSACAKALNDRLNTHRSARSRDQLAQCWHLSTDETARTPRNLGRDTFDKLHEFRNDDRSLSTIQNLVSPQHKDRVLYRSVVQLLIRRY